MLVRPGFWKCRSHRIINDLHFSPKLTSFMESKIFGRLKDYRTENGFSKVQIRSTWVVVLKKLPTLIMHVRFSRKRTRRLNGLSIRSANDSYVKIFTI
jgi:hypothetical protein